MGKRKVYFEMMRIIACGLVIFNHLPGYLLFGTSTGVKQFLYMSLTMITRINVPLFFMISGALLLGRSEDFKDVFRKRFIRVLILLLLFTFILYTVFKIKNLVNGIEYEYSVSKFIYGFMNNQMEGVLEVLAYWYLYSYLGFLFVLPLLQRIAKGFTKTEFFALLSLHFLISSLLPMINILLSKNQMLPLVLTGRFSVPFAVDRAFFYPLTGYYLEKNVDMNKVKTKHLSGLLLAAITGIVASNLCTYYDAGVNGEFLQNYVMLFDYLTSITAFIFIKYIFVIAFPKLNNGRISRIICFIGSMTLGIYLLDPCFKLIFYDKYEMLAEPFLPTLLVSAGWIIISMTCGILITYGLKRIPLIKKII